MNTKQAILSSCLAFVFMFSNSRLNSKSLIMKNNHQTDNSNKSILARGCDPRMSFQAAKGIPPLIGNPEYTATTSDADFFKKLREKQYSIVFFAPGACRFSAVSQPIPGGNIDTKGWTLKQYREYVYQTQGDDIQIVETTAENEVIGLLKKALSKARTTK